MIHEIGKSQVFTYHVKWLTLNNNKKIPLVPLYFISMLTNNVQIMEDLENKQFDKYYRLYGDVGDFNNIYINSKIELVHDEISVEDYSNNIIDKICERDYRKIKDFSLLLSFSQTIYLTFLFLLGNNQIDLEFIKKYFNFSYDNLINKLLEKLYEMPSISYTNYTNTIIATEYAFKVYHNNEIENNIPEELIINMDAIQKVNPIPVISEKIEFSNYKYFLFNVDWSKIVKMFPLYKSIETSQSVYQSVKKNNSEYTDIAYLCKNDNNKTDLFEDITIVNFADEVSNTTSESINNFFQNYPSVCVRIKKNNKYYLYLVDVVQLYKNFKISFSLNRKNADVINLIKNLTVVDDSIKLIDDSSRYTFTEYPDMANRSSIQIDNHNIYAPGIKENKNHDLFYIPNFKINVYLDNTFNNKVIKNLNNIINSYNGNNSHTGTFKLYNANNQQNTLYKCNNFVNDFKLNNIINVKVINNFNGDEYIDALINNMNIDVYCKAISNQPILRSVKFNKYPIIQKKFIFKQASNISFKNPIPIKRQSFNRNIKISQDTSNNLEEYPKINNSYETDKNYNNIINNSQFMIKTDVADKNIVKDYNIPISDTILQNYSNNSGLYMYNDIVELKIKKKEGE